MNTHTVFVISGALALALTLLVYAVRGKQRILEIKTVVDSLWLVNYLAKGAIAYSAAAQAILCVARNLVFYSRDKGKKWASGSVWCWVFLLFFATTPIYTWIGPASLIPGAASVLSTLALYQPNVQRTRWAVMLASFLCIFYQIFINNPFGICSNCIAVLSAVIGLVRERGEKN